jgi:acetyl-CoA synthetase
VSDLPRTRSQKIMRRVVKSLALGQDPGDLTSLENPQAVEELKQV